MEKKALGKGLNALFRSNPLEDEVVPAGPVVRVPVSEIVPNPYQPRLEMNPERLQELVESVRTHGVIQPLLVRRHEDGYQLVAGERRFRASQAAGLDSVPVVVRECTNREMLELALIENIQREDINPIDAAIAFRRLIDEFGLTQEDLASRVGKSRPALANTLRLLNLPPHIQRRVALGEVSEGHGRALLTLATMPEAQNGLLERILAEHLTVRDAERLAGETLEPRRKPQAEGTAARDPHLASLEERLQRRFGTRVVISRSGTRGAVRIEFYDDDQLDHILEMLSGP